MTTYRVGHHQPRNLYRGDQYIGVMFDPDDTAYIVDALEGRIRAEHWEAIGLLGLVRQLRRDGEGEILTWARFDEACDDFMQRRQERGTPDVDYARGARQALAEVRRLLEHAAGPDEEIAAGTVRHALQTAAASLGVDEEAPLSPLSAPATAQEPSAGGTPRPEPSQAISAGCGKCGSPLAPCLEACGRLAQCGEPWCVECHPDGGWTRESERKADQAFPCECEGFLLAPLQSPPGSDWCRCGHERADHHDGHGPCTREAVMLG